MINHRFFSKIDWLLICLLSVAGLWLTAVSVNKPVHPAEDAAMLMRYSQHLSQGNGIVWNVGSPPVDGATDFLFMALLAGLYTLGGQMESTVLWVGGIAHLLTVVLVYFGIRRYFKGSTLAAILSASFFLFGPGMRYVEASFGTTFFALFCCLSWLAAQTVAEHPQSMGRAFLFAFISLLMGLTRPEGVLIAGFMLAAVLFKLGWKASIRIMVVFTGVFLFLGGAYFLWRWAYFGYPLPTPFYKKGGGSLYITSLQESWKAVLELTFPFWLAYAGGLVCLVWAGVKTFVLDQNWFDALSSFLSGLFEKEKRRSLIDVCRFLGGLLLAGFILGLFRQSSSLHETLVFGRYSAQYAGLLTALLATGLLVVLVDKWLPVPLGNSVKVVSIESNENLPSLETVIRDTVYVAIPVTGFILMWVLLSNEMNYLWRFQYPILPVILMSWPLLMNDLWPVLRLPSPVDWPGNIRGIAGLTGILLAIGMAGAQIDRWKIDYQADGRFEVAQYLAQYADRKYTIATTEAGLLPLYSGWQAVDTWGLNDAWIAHNGGITAEYLERVNPEIIMFHADFSPVKPRTEAGDAWGAMTLILDTYARERGYSLAAVYGESPVDTHYYYVRSDFPESPEIVAYIQSLDGGGYRYGSQTLDYNKLMWKKD